MSLPRNLKFGSKIESSSARAYKSNIQPVGASSYGLGEVCTFQIPTRNNLVLVPSESYLKFNFKVTNGATANVMRLDSCGIAGIINNIKVYHGSNLLESINEYALLSKIAMDIFAPTDACYGKYNVMAGTRNDLVVTTNTVAANVATTPDTTMILANSLRTAVHALTLPSLQINSGELISNALAGAAVSTDTTYCISLISILGTLCPNQYFPLFACSSSPIRLEITFQDSIYKMMSASHPVAAGALGVIISNIEYVGSFIELSDNAMGMVQSSLLGQPLQFCTQSYRNYQTTFPLTDGVSTQVNFPISAKFSSLKSLFLTIRSGAHINTPSYFSNSCNSHSLQDYSFRVGSQIMPSRPVNSYQECFAELLKAAGSFSDINHQPSIEKFTYTAASPVANTALGNTNSNSFVIGLDMETYSNANKDSIFSGFNSLTDDIYATLNFSNGLGAVGRFDAFALFDQVVVFENGTCYVKF